VGSFSEERTIEIYKLYLFKDEVLSNDCPLLISVLNLDLQKGSSRVLIETNKAARL
jgi:hypothetical protein